MPIVGGYMPSYYQHKIWDKFKVGLYPDDNDFMRSADIFRLIPYFWDKEIYLDLAARRLKKLQEAEAWDYEWQLCGLDDTVIKSGQDTLKLEPNKIWSSKKHALALGYLSPNKFYRVFVTITKGHDKSPRMLLAAFAIKDRDELKLQLLILIIGIILTLILTNVFK